jgi:hypothetical protein
MPSVSIKGLTTRRGLLVLGISVGVVAATIGTATAAQGTAHNVASTAGGPTKNVIVMLRNQHTNLPITKGKASARTNAYHADQTPLVGVAKKFGAKNLHGFSTVNAIAATVTQAQANDLAANPSVAAIFPDLPLKGAPIIDQASGAPSASSGRSPTVHSKTCPSDPTKPLLEPEALQITHTAFLDKSTPQAQNIVDGTGIKVAWIADGVDINNPDFIRADGSHVFIDYKDFSGDGLAAPTGAAEAFGDASSIAAQGRQTYDIANYVNPAHPIPAGCTIKIRGMAPGASEIGLKVFGNSNTAPTSRFIEAIDYAVADGADVLNESFGGNPFPDTSTDPITLADNAAVAAGVTVVTSTGDAGINGTVGSPGSADDGILTVGATTQFRSYQQQTYAGAQLSNGTWVNNNISGLSSAGTTTKGRALDLVAPGDLGWALCTPNLALYEECTNDAGAPSPIQDFGGTSQSSPLTAGAAALVIQAYEKTHHGVRPSPFLVDKLLTSTATDLGHPAYEQGAGELNSLKAVQAAESWKDGNGRPAVTGSALIVNKAQLTPTGAPGARVSRSLTVTNLSGSTQRVTASTRTLGRTVNTLTGSVRLNTASAPFYVDAFGIKRSYAKVTFHVGRNIDRLTMSEANPPLPSGAPVASRIILIDPNGVYTAYSIPQGGADFAVSDVRYPTAGTWTAYLAVSQSTGYNDVFHWQVLLQDYVSHGSVSPASFTLAPGASKRVTVKSTEPAQPSDLSASVQFNGSKSGVTSVPMILRAAVPPHNYAFSGTITGGNGRQAGGVAQSNFYYLDVPRNAKDLGVGIVFADPDNLNQAWLTAPNGQVYSYDSNQISGNALQAYVRAPMAGRWTLSLEVANPVSGNFVSSPFAVTIRYNSVRVSAPALPNSARTKLAQGTAVTVPVTITNTGVAPLQYFADPRLNQLGTLGLANINSPNTFPLPQPADVLPAWLLPTHSSTFVAQAVADQPVNMDLFYFSGDPDLYSAAQGNGAQVVVSAPQVSPGIWATDLGQSGPFNGPAPAGTVTVSAFAIGQLFDTAVESSTGDYWQAGVTGQGAGSSAMSKLARQLAKRATAVRSGEASSDAAPAAAGPKLLLPGQSGQIMVTITPGATKGSLVQGHLYIDTVDAFTGAGDELIDLPYSYTVS